jgi:hypothetical protein
VALERRQDCLVHAEKLGVLSNKVENVNLCLSELNESLKKYMEDGLVYRAEVKEQREFIAKHKPVIEALTIGKFVTDCVFKIACFVGAITAAILGVFSLNKN